MSEAAYFLLASVSLTLNLEVKSIYTAQKKKVSTFVITTIS